MTQLEWPATEAERLAWFAGLGLRDGEPLPPRADDQGCASLRFSTEWSEVDGNASTMADGLLGMSLFCYNERGHDGAAARAGFAALRDHLSRSFGPPVEEWGPASEPACLWRPSPLMFEMYCFQRHSSGVMVGPSHAERTATYEAELGDAELKAAAAAQRGRSERTLLVPSDSRRDAVRRSSRRRRR